MIQIIFIKAIDIDSRLKSNIFDFFIVLLIIYNTIMPVTPRMNATVTISNTNGLNLD